MNRVARWTALVTLFAALAACSSGPERPEHGGSPTSAAAPTHEEFIAAADAICRRVEDQAAAPRRELTSGPGVTPDKAAALVPRVVGPQRSGLTELRRLTPPPADATELAAMLRESEVALSKLDDAAAAAARGDAPAVAAAVSEWTERTSMVGDTERRFGFNVCGAATPPPPSELNAGQKRFIADGDALCRAADTATEPQFALVFGGDPAQAAGALAAVVTIVGKMIDDLAGLTPPPGDEARISAIVSGQRRGLAVLVEAQRLAAAGEADALHRQLDQLDPAFGPSERAFREYGFQNCGSR